MKQLVNQNRLLCDKNFASELYKGAGQSDDMSIDVDEVLEQMEDGSFKSSSLKSLDQNALETLKEEINQKAGAIQGTEIICDLEELCPTRQVRSFRVIYIRDVFEVKRGPSPTGQMTIWDAGDGSDERDIFSKSTNATASFVITNLQPTQCRAWMPHNQPGAEIYLSTRRDSRILQCNLDNL